MRDDSAKENRFNIKEHWFWIALVLVIIAGYQLGKDRAMTLNEKDAVHASV